MVVPHVLAILSSLLCLYISILQKKFQFRKYPLAKGRESNNLADIELGTQFEFLNLKRQCTKTIQQLKITKGKAIGFTKQMGVGVRGDCLKDNMIGFC